VYATSPIGYRGRAELQKHGRGRITRSIAGMTDEAAAAAARRRNGAAQLIMLSSAAASSCHTSPHPRVTQCHGAASATRTRVHVETYFA